MFRVAIPNASTFEKFEAANIAIVDNVEYKENSTFKEAISSVSNLGSNTKDEDIMFNVKVIAESDAKKMLDNNEIIGYIKVEQNPNIKNFDLLFMDIKTEHGERYFSIEGKSYLEILFESLKFLTKKEVYL
jgi:hypothetical protein